MKGKTSICSFPFQFTERCDWPVSINWSVEIGIWAQWRIQWQGPEGAPPPLILDQTEVRSAEKSFWDIGQLIISLHYLIAFINICLGSERESDKLSKGRVCL